MTEVSGQRTEVRRQRSEDRGPVFALQALGFAFGYDPTGRFQLRPDTSSFRLRSSSYDGTGRRGRQKSDDRRQMSDDRSPKSELGDV